MQTLLFRSAGLLLLAIFCFVYRAPAQDRTPFQPPAYPGPAQGSVRTWEARVPVADAASLIRQPLSGVQLSTSYLDGLGRPLQTVVRQGSLVSGAVATDLVHPMDYDSFGRTPRSFLPYAASDGSGSFQPDPFLGQSRFYLDPDGSPLRGQSENFFYSSTTFEPSPLQRTQTVSAPGVSWTGAGRGIQTQYLSNTLSDSVMSWAVAASSGPLGSYRAIGFYAPGQLQKQVVTDEQLHQQVSFFDRSGKLVLRKEQLTASGDAGAGSGYSGWLSTAYLYDDLSQLRCVIQPRGMELVRAAGFELSDPVILLQQCFRYAYDPRGRLSIKQVPGSGEAFLVYDRWDRLLLTQDAALRPSGRWLLTKYDRLNRLVITAFYSPSPLGYGSSMQQYIDQQPGGRFELPLSGSALPYTLNQSFPSVAPEDLLTVTCYDDYQWASTLNGEMSQFDPLEGEYPLEGSLPAAAFRPALTARGLVTATLFRVLEGDLLPCIYFYDDKGRLLQSRSRNITGGIDVSSTRYSWSGLPLLTILHQQAVSGQGAPVQSLLVLTRSTYDPLGRLIRVDKKAGHSLVSGGQLPASWTPILVNHYDALGQLRRQQLGQEPRSSAPTPLTTLDYAYNIRGWLLSVNKDDLSAATGGYFAFELGYDKPRSMGRVTPPSYNGNITGSLWKSPGDPHVRSFDYTYDPLSRLLSADFNQQVSGAGSTAVFDKSAGLDFSEQNISYDANGNLETYRRHGFAPGGSRLIDNLSYRYQDQGRSNRLLEVSDAVASSGQSPALGDFHDGVNGLEPDYLYDPSGNLTRDLNKAITRIDYNHLNLPRQITVEGKGTIAYRYDALGRKLLKTTTDRTQSPAVVTTTTTYLDGVLYESRSSTAGGAASEGSYTLRLLSLPHEQGRIRYQPRNSSLVYDYFLKDHLGNIRLVLTDEKTLDKYPLATLEEGHLDLEDDYYAIDPAAVVDASTVPGLPAYSNDNGPGNTPEDPAFQAAASQRLYRLQAPGYRTGLGITLKVMARDQLDIHAKSYYFVNSASEPGSPLPASEILQALLSGPLGAAASAAKGAAATASDLPGVVQGIAALLQQQAEGQAGSRPPAFINYLFFNEQFQCVRSGFSPVGSPGQLKDHFEELQHLVASQNGYVYIYASNQSEVPVFFDNLQIIHSRGPILEETHYYPFGLTMQGISSKAAGGVENKKGFNGNEIQSKEFCDGSSLDLYDFNARTYDLQLGRFLQVDPLIEKGEQESSSSYQFSRNNPIRFNDPDGKCPNCLTALIGAGIGALVGAVAEGGSQLYHSGKITSWNAVGGSALQGAVTGGVAGFTGGSSLLISVSASAGANVLGGAMNNMVQGEAINAGSVIKDASIGAVLGAGSKLLNNEINAVLSKSKTAVAEAVTNTSAKSVVNGLNLNKQLASQAQMNEAGQVIAGGSHNTPLRKAGDLANEYGGNPLDWVKKSSSSYTAKDGTKISTHWEENTQTGQRVNIKTKLK